MRRFTVASGLVIACGAGALGAAATGGTYGAWSDRQDVTGNIVGAGSWGPALPAACGDPHQYAHIVFGTSGDDVLRGGNQRQIIMGLGGNDTIYGGNSGDCLVGGDGNDTLVGGNGKDVLLGEAGDDTLDGGNGKDVLDGGGEVSDVCDGGNGKDTITNCGSTP